MIISPTTLRALQAIEAGTAEDNLMTGFIVAEDDDGKKLTPEEVKKFCITMVAGGAESSVFLLGNQVVSFLEMPNCIKKCAKTVP